MIQRMPINSASALVISVVTVAIALSLQSNIIAALIPRMAGTSLAEVVYSFGPTLYSAGILAMLFGITIYLGFQAFRTEAQFSILIMMVITILIAASLAATIGLFADQAIAATCGSGSTEKAVTASSLVNSACPAGSSTVADGKNFYIGSLQVGSKTAAAGDALVAPIIASTKAPGAGIALLAKILNDLALTRTISGFYEVGYALSLLSAIAALANVGLGGGIGRAAAGIRGQMILAVVSVHSVVLKVLVLR